VDSDANSEPGVLGQVRAESAERAQLREVLETLATEQVGTEHSALDEMPVDELVTSMIADSASITSNVLEQAPGIAAAINGIVERMRRGGRLIYIGAGTAGRLGVLDASEIPPTFGTDPSQVIGLIAGGPSAIHTAVENAEDSRELGATQLAEVSLRPTDAVVGLSASGRTPFVIGAIEYAREIGAFTVGFACNADSAVGAAADVAIETVVGPEFLTGSTRLKAGTAQKLVLNAISTITMIRLGKVYGNLMVDLKATNEKLRARSERTVMLATGVDAATAASALASVDGWVKAAILVAASGLSSTDAISLLAEHDGVLRDAIENVQTRGS
jgi:N-acetylmuramic acid 6-phosphate etherase